MEHNFALEPDQVKRLEKWQAKIKKKYKQYGTYTYMFTPCGMGTAIKVYSHLAKEELDLSDVDNW
jgi:hypothetical protein